MRYQFQNQQRDNWDALGLSRWCVCDQFRLDAFPLFLVRKGLEGLRGICDLCGIIQAFFFFFFRPDFC